MTDESDQALDPVLLAVISNRLDSIVREMTNTLLRSARSAVPQPGPASVDLEAGPAHPSEPVAPAHWTPEHSPILEPSD